MSQVVQALSAGGLNEFEELGRECFEYAEAARAEKGVRLRLLGELEPLLRQLRIPVTLGLEMRGLFPEAIKLTVGSDLSLKATYRGRSADSIPLLSLEDAFVDVMKMVLAKVEREVAERRRREAAKAKPKLRAELSVVKKRVPIFGRWRYRLVVFNLGGDACSVALTVRDGDSDGDSLFRGFEISKGDSVNCDLRGYKFAPGSKNVTVDVGCEDSRGVTYSGAARMPQDGGYRTIRLKKVTEEEG